MHEIIASTKKDEVKIRAISELHSIEMDIFNLWKQLPNLDIQTQTGQVQEQDGEYKVPEILFVEDFTGVEEIPDNDSSCWMDWQQCDGCKRYWSRQELLDYHRKRSIDPNCSNNSGAVLNPT